MPRLLIADDHVLIREGLRKLLSREVDIQIVGEAADFVELLAQVQTTPADLVLMDVNMPGGGAWHTLERVRALRPGLPVLVLSMMPESQVGLDFLIAGAAGYIAKDAPADDLIAAIRRVARGYRHVSPALSQRLARARGPSHELLSPRERSVLYLIASGITVKEIAARLGLSISTVHTHRARVLDKLKLHSDVELSRYAVRHRLVD